MKLYYGLYARKSDDDKSVTEKSIGDQIAELTPLIEREHLEVFKTWKESKSAKKPRQRPDYSEMIRLIERGQINAIICWHINRLVRNMEEGGKLVQLFVEGYIQEIRTPSGTYRTGDNILPLVIEAASATQFSLDHTRNVNRGMKSKFALGGCNYRAPQGYLNARHPINPDIGIIIKDPQRFDLIRKAWELFLTGAYTPVQVVETLNNQWGYRTRETKKEPSGPLSENHGYALFANPFYVGFVREKGRLVKSPEIEPMVTPGEFERAQQLLGKGVRQKYRVHDYAYTGLMVCGYCGRQITGERKVISTGLWENYRCTDADRNCTKQGMARALVERRIIEALESITIDPQLCTTALENIVRDLHLQTGAIHSLHEQQNATLAELEKKLGKLTDMWLSGLLSDEQTFKERQQSLSAERDRLILATEESRCELEKMRANAIAASNYAVFARDHFLVASDQRKREIAHALGTSYLFYGREKQITLEVHPLLVELVKYARKLKPAIGPQKPPIEPGKSGSYNRKKTTLTVSVLSGGTGTKEIEVPAKLIEALRAHQFPDLG